MLLEKLIYNNLLGFFIVQEVVDDSDGCGAKFSVVVVSPRFTGITLLQRQRLVNEVLKEEMQSIHALSQRTLTPEQWATQTAASAPGKVILFGEHSVVYGRHAIAASLGRRTTVTITHLEEQLLVLHLPAVGLPRLALSLPQDETNLPDFAESLQGSLLDVPVVTEGADSALMARLGWWARETRQLGTSKAAEQSLGVLGFLHSLLLPPSRFCQGLEVHVTSQLKPGAGTGSSAAYAVALAAALASVAEKHLNVAQIENLAWKGEHLVHGTPSGLDTAISANGGLLSFARTAGGVTSQCMTPAWSLRVLLVDSGVERNTRHMVQTARERLDWLQDATKPLLDTFDQVALTAVKAVQEPQTSGYPRLEHLVHANQGLLGSLGVSHVALDAIIATAARHGLAAKLTGAGGGGNALVLLSPELSQEALQALQRELAQQGFASSEETLFGAGMCIESN